MITIYYKIWLWMASKLLGWRFVVVRPSEDGEAVESVLFTNNGQTADLFPTLERMERLAKPKKKAKNK